MGAGGSKSKNKLTPEEIQRRKQCARIREEVLETEQSYTSSLDKCVQV